MRSLIVIAALTAAATPAWADSARCVDPSGPQPIAAVRNAGAGTVIGTIVAVDRKGFVLDDGSERIRVRAGELSAAGLQPESRATVTGRVRHDALRAHQVIRDDGSVLPGSRDRCGRERRADAKRE